MPTNKRQGGDANTRRDDDEQRHLRNVVLEEVEAILHKHECGGAIFIGSRNAAAWRFVLPKWSGLTTEAGGIVRIRISSRTPALRAIGDSTMHYVARMRDMCIEGAELFIALFMEAEDRLGGPGSIQHKRGTMKEPTGD